MKYTNKAKLNEDILENLGVGYSVHYLMEKLGITHEELCECAAEFPATKLELKKWYKGYDFSVKAKEPAKPLEIKEKTTKRTRKSKEDISEELVKVSEG